MVLHVHLALVVLVASMLPGQGETAPGLGDVMVLGEEPTRQNLALNAADNAPGTRVYLRIEGRDKVRPTNA